MYKRGYKNRGSDSDDSDNEDKFVVASKPKIFISGPNKAVKLYNSKTGQTVYLFGEWHGYENTCDEKQLKQLNRNNKVYHIVNYLAELFSGGAKIDFYLEAPLVYLLPPERQKAYNEQLSVAENFLGKGKAGILVELRDVFKNCFHPETRGRCVYRNTRMHYTDVRPLYKLEDMARRIPLIKNTEQWEGFKEKFEDEIKDLSIIHDCSSYTNYIYNKVLESKSIIKQLEKNGIPKEMFASLIEKVCSHFSLDRYAEKYYHMLISPELPKAWLQKNPNGDEPDNVEQDLSDILQSQLAILHDLYTFLRMIKKMDGQYQQNIIFYGGLAHYEMLRLLLSDVGFVQIGPESNQFKTKTRCLELLEDLTFPRSVQKVEIAPSIEHRVLEPKLDFSEIDKEFDELSDDDD